jgi:hypothetical protein
MVIGCHLSKKHSHKQHKFDNDIEKQIVGVASANPRSFGLGFSTWSLCVLAGFIMYDLKVDRISHATEIRNILLKHKIKYRKSKTVLSNKSNSSECILKKSTFNNQDITNHQILCYYI